MSKTAVSVAPHCLCRSYASRHAPAPRTSVRPSARDATICLIASSDRSRRGDSVGQAMVKSAARAASSQVGRQVVRGLLGGVLRSSRR